MDNHLEKNLQSYFIDIDKRDLLQKWIREIKKIHIEIIGDVYKDTLYTNYSFRLKDMTKSKTILESSTIKYNNYDEALEQALKLSLKIIK